MRPKETECPEGWSELGTRRLKETGDNETEELRSAEDHKAGDDHEAEGVPRPCGWSRPGTLKLEGTIRFDGTGDHGVGDDLEAGWDQGLQCSREPGTIMLEAGPGLQSIAGDYEAGEDHRP